MTTQETVRQLSRIVKCMGLLLSYLAPGMPAVRVDRISGINSLMVL